MVSLLEIIFYKSAEAPQFIARLHVIPEPGMAATPHFVEPHLATVQSPSEAVSYNLAVMGCFYDDGVGMHRGAAVLCRAVVYREGYGQIFTPSPTVVEVALPGGGLVIRAVDLEEWNSHILLKGIAHVPARLPPAILLPLRKRKKAGRER